MIEVVKQHRPVGSLGGSLPPVSSMASLNNPDEVHIRHVILFLIKSGETAAAAHRKLVETYGNIPASLRTCQRWASEIEKGTFTIEDKERSGRPMEMDLKVLQEYVEDDPYQTTRDLSIITGHDHRTVARNLKKLGKVQKLGRWVPHELSDFDKNRRIFICRSLLSLHRRHPFLDRLVTGDEKWVEYSNVKRRPQWVNKKEAARDIAKPDLHPKKVLLSCWWSKRGMEYWELLPKGQTITSRYYVEQLRNLKKHLETTRGIQPDIAFHHDNARPHSAKETAAELDSYGWLILPQPPYSPDLAPSDYWLFSHLQRFLDGKTFDDENDLKSSLASFFSAQTPQFWTYGINSLPQRWRHVVDNDGIYV